MVRPILVGAVVAPRGDPVTWKVKEPAMAVDETLTVRVLVAPAVVGVTEAGLNEVHETPTGRVELTQESVTDGAVPEISFAVMVTVPELPRVMVTGPLFESE